MNDKIKDLIEQLKQTGMKELKKEGHVIVSPEEAKAMRELGAMIDRVFKPRVSQKEKGKRIAEGLKKTHARRKKAEEEEISEDFEEPETKDEKTEREKESKEFVENVRNKMQSQILNALGSGKIWFTDILKCLDAVPRGWNKQNMLCKQLDILIAQGQIKRIGSGKYALAEQTEDEKIGLLTGPRKKIYDAIAGGSESLPEIAKKSGIEYASVAPYLTKMIREKLVKRTGFGKYALPGKTTASEFIDKLRKEKLPEEEEEE